MKSKIFLLMHCLAVILFGLGIAPDRSAAAEGRQGRVTAGINLRAAPGLSGKVITGLEAGTVVAVTGEQSGWYQIAYEDDTYGYRGWVYGKYVDIFPDVPPLTDTPSASAHAQPAATSEKPVPRPEAPPADPGDAALPVNMPANTIELVQAAANPQAVEQVPAAPSLAEAVETGPQTAAGVISRPESVPAAATAGPNHAAVSRKAAPAAARPGDLLSVILKVSSVLLSCLALMISYRTFHLVAAAGRPLQKR